MWYEIIPSAALMYILLSGPRWILPKVTDMCTGTRHMRDLGTQFQRDMFHRDNRLTGGHPWERIRLEAVPDEK